MGNPSSRTFRVFCTFLFRSSIPSDPFAAVRAPWTHVFVLHTLHVHVLSCAVSCDVCFALQRLTRLQRRWHQPPLSIPRERKKKGKHRISLSHFPTKAGLFRDVFGEDDSREIEGEKERKWVLRDRTPPEATLGEGRKNPRCPSRTTATCRTIIPPFVRNSSAGRGKIPLSGRWIAIVPHVGFIFRSCSSTRVLRVLRSRAHSHSHRSRTSGTRAAVGTCLDT